MDSDASVAEAIAGIYAGGGEIDVLVNHAGVERVGTVEEAPLEHFRTCMETNYFGVIRCIQAVLPRMRERGSGTIVNISSVSGRIASGSMAPDVASKWALEASSEALAQDVTGMGIRVAIVEPGIIDTRMAALFVQLLAGANGPGLIARKVRKVIESDDWTLRHPAGPDAAWIRYGSQSDAEWEEQLAREFGMTVKLD